MVDYSKWDKLDSDESGDEPETWPESKAAPWHDKEIDDGPNAPEWDRAQVGEADEPEETYYLDNPARNVETSVIPQYCIQCGADFPDTNGVRSHAVAVSHFLCIACFLPFETREAYDEHKRTAHDKAFEMEDTRLEAMLMIMAPLQVGSFLFLPEGPPTRPKAWGLEAGTGGVPKGRPGLCGRRRSLEWLPPLAAGEGAAPAP